MISLSVRRKSTVSRSLLQQQSRGRSSNSLRCAAGGVQQDCHCVYYGRLVAERGLQYTQADKRIRAEVLVKEMGFQDGEDRSAQ